MSEAQTGPGPNMMLGEGETIIASLFDNDRLSRAIAMGVPSFVRRAQAVEDEMARLGATISIERSKRLQTFLPALRVVEQNRQRGDELPNAVLQLLDELKADPNFQKRTPSPARDARRLLQDLAKRINRFNRRWSDYLDSISLNDVHTAQTKYNRYYAMEREIALRGLPPQRFTPLPLLARDELRAHWPRLSELD